MHRLGCLVAIGALAVAVGVVTAGPAAAAKGGNNDAAKACQHGGWMGSFKNQGDCVNDAAQAKPGSAGSTVCGNIRGSFHLNATMWTCDYTPARNDNFPTDANTVALQAACGQDRGTFQAQDIGIAPMVRATCFLGQGLRSRD